MVEVVVLVESRESVEVVEALGSSLLLLLVDVC